MKQGKTLEEFYNELKRRSIAMQDYKVPARMLNMPDDASSIMLEGIDTRYNLSNLGHTQLGEKLNIPKKYYDTIRAQYPELLVATVNYLLPRQNEGYLIRTLDNNVRAVLTPKYRCLDDLKLIETVLPVLIKAGAKVVSCEVTETRTYLKVSFPNLRADIKVGDPVEAGFCFENSEVGLGRMSAWLYIVRLCCLNGAKAGKDYGFAKNHSGKGIEFTEAVEGYYTDNTRRLDDAALWAKVKDVVNGMIGSTEGFLNLIAKMKESTTQEIKGDVVKVIEKVAKDNQLTIDDSDGIMKALIKEGDLTRWGLTNAITAYSQQVADYDKATELEALGGKIIELPKSQWESLSLAA